MLLRRLPYLCLFLTLTSAANANEPVPRRPVISPAWWPVCETPDLGELAGPDPERQHVVDHGFIQDETGTWRLWACIRGTAVGRLIYGWKADSLRQSLWEPTGIKLRAKAEFDEKIRDGQETVGAPYFVRHDGRWFCFYHGGGVRRLSSDDGIHYTRDQMPDGGYRTAIPGGRDVTLLHDGDRWISYATVTDHEPNRPKTRDNLTSWVVASVSDNFDTWTGSYVVSKGGKPGDGPVDSESPFVVKLDGYYYLFRCSSITFKTYVYRSRDPLNFGVDDDSKLIAEFDVKAPELIRHDGQWYISDLHDFQGIRMTELEWEEDTKKRSGTGSGFRR